MWERMALSQVLLILTPEPSSRRSARCPPGAAPPAAAGQSRPVGAVRGASRRASAAEGSASCGRVAAGGAAAERAERQLENWARPSERPGASGDPGVSVMDLPRPVL